MSKQSLYVAAGSPAQCMNPNCGKRFEGCCIRGNNDTATTAWKSARKSAWRSTSATSPTFALVPSWYLKNRCERRAASKVIEKLERAIGIEPTTFSLGS